MLRTPTRTTRYNLASQYLSLGLNVVGGLVVTPLALHTIAPAQYGAWLLTGDVLAWLSLVDPGLSAVLAQRVAHGYGAGQPDQIGRYLVSGLLLAGLVTALLFGLGAAALPHLYLVIRVDDLHPVQEAFVVALVGTGLVLVSQTLFAVTQGLQSGLGNGLIYNGALAVSLAATLVGLARGWGLLALAGAVVLRGALYALGNGLYLWYRLRAEKIPVRFSWATLRELASPLSVTALARLAGVLLVNLENALLARRLGVAAVPVYALSRKGPDLARLVVERGVVAFGPALTLSVGRGDAAAVRRVVVRLGYGLIWGLGLLAGGTLLFNEPFMRLWVGAAFFPGETTNVLLVAYVALQALTNALAAVGMALGQIRPTSRLQLGQALLHAGCIGVGTWAFGLKGLLAGAGLAFLAMGFFFVRLVSREIALAGAQRAQFFREITRQSLLTAGLVGVGRAGLPTANAWSAFAGQVGLFVLVYALLTGLFSPTARALFSVPFPKKTAWKP